MELPMVEPVLVCELKQIAHGFEDIKCELMAYCFATVPYQIPQRSAKKFWGGFSKSLKNKVQSQIYVES